MNREYTVEEFMECADVLLKNCPNISIGTDIICGFPTENGEHWEETMVLIRKYHLPMVNISQFYPRPGTVAAKWKRVPTQEVKKRSTALTHLFDSYRCYDHLQDTTQRVIYLFLIIGMGYRKGCKEQGLFSCSYKVIRQSTP
jgi:threonylcarbamoyladenosine tRNA methylthiotransferase CDKAL1